MNALNLAITVFLFVASAYMAASLVTLILDTIRGLRRRQSDVAPLINVNAPEYPEFKAKLDAALHDRNLS